jgi:tRNA(adenine34) deaminase
MKQAYQLALSAYKQGEVPIGAIILERQSGIQIAAAYNEVEQQKDPTCHAEILVIQRACEKLGTKFLEGYDLYVTLEPCPMCAAAISLSRIGRLYFGAYDIKSGGVEHGPRVLYSAAMHYKPEIIGGVMEQECGQLIATFFAQLRQK